MTRLLRRRRASAQDGFALLEILVATAIAAISLTVIYGMIATSMRVARSEQASVEASLLARSLLAEVAGGARAEPGEYWAEQGTEPRWRLRLTPANGPDAVNGRRFLKVDLAIWHLGEDRAPLAFETEISTRDDPASPK